MPDKNKNELAMFRLPLNYRILITMSGGGLISLIGTIIFLAESNDPLWSAFGIAVLLLGGTIASIGLVAWCGKDHAQSSDAVETKNPVIQSDFKSQ